MLTVPESVAVPTRVRTSPRLVTSWLRPAADVIPPTGLDHQAGLHLLGEGASYRRPEHPLR